MSMKDINIDEIISCLRYSAREATTEEELKIRASGCIEEKICKPLGLNAGRYEYLLLSGGRIDALYGSVVVEFKAPGKLTSKKDITDAKNQVINYITSLAQKEKNSLDRYLGVIISDRIAFLRHDKRNNEWILRGPYDINKEVVIKLVEALRGLSRESLDAEHLLKDFGSKSNVAKKVIIILYNKLIKALGSERNERVTMFFDEWRRNFTQATGYDPQRLKHLNELVAEYELKENVNFDAFLFSVHTYFALLMKVLAAEIVYLYGQGKFLRSYIAELDEAYTSGNVKRLKEKLTELENGGLFKNLMGIVNFLEGDYFSWYLDVLDDNLASAMADIFRKLSNYELATPQLEPEFTRDMLKRLYQNLMPTDIRHDLGEYYTPDWLADQILNDVGLTKEFFENIGRDDLYKPLELRVLDPSCGSGTFLIMYIKRLRRYAEEHYLTDQLPNYVLKNVIGFDLNPLAVLTARTNYLLALGDLLTHVEGEIEIPVYLADSIMVETRSTIEGTLYVLRTSIGEFKVPAEVVKKGQLNEVLNEIERAVRKGFDVDQFLLGLEAKNINVSENSKKLLKDLYNLFLNLEQQGKDKVWVAVLKNTFAPLIKEKFDYVVGNPPWVNWENLPEEYRKKSELLWKDYGLLGKGAGFKRDLAMLFLVRCFDRYLKDGGLLGFLVPFTVFKTQAGSGFRKYIAQWKISVIHDMVSLNPFEGAKNRTSAIVVEKSKLNKKSSENLKIRCVIWANEYNTRSIPTNMHLEDVLGVTKRKEMFMMPLGFTADAPWIQITEEVERVLEKVLKDQTIYRAHEGVNTAYNQIYFIIKLNKDKDNYLTITNSSQGSKKKKANQITTKIESDLVYPLIRGRDIRKWYVKYTDSYVILPHDPKTGKPIEEEDMKSHYPKTYEYFYNFIDDLIKRQIKPFINPWKKIKEFENKGLKNEVNDILERLRHRFYIVDNVGSYTFSLYKVVWKEVSSRMKPGGFHTAVVKPIGNRPVIPDHTVIFISLDDEKEAYYVAGVLNSTVAAFIGTYMLTSYLKKLFIPKFDKNKQIHVKIAELSKKAHEIAKEIYEKNRIELQTELSRIEEDLDKAVAQLYGITDHELEEVKEVYNILKGVSFEEESE